MADHGGTIVLRRCELRLPPQARLAHLDPHTSLMLQLGGRGTVADCACSGLVVVLDQGSSLLHTGIAFAAGMTHTLIAHLGGVARELPAAGGPRAGV
jgi:hypothetical protein